MASSFLHLVARAFSREDLSNYCFIFPNRRSGVFFQSELKKVVSGTFIQPQITTISDFLSETTGLIEANRIELLLALYTAYADIVGENAEDFDRFAFWGDVILSDFNDIDKYLVEPSKIFENIIDLKNISSNYLTQEQKEILRTYFGEQIDMTEYDSFWKNIPSKDDDDSSSQSYMRIWQILDKLYVKYNEVIDERGIAYSGKIYKKAVEFLKSDSFALSYSKYIFVGFNVLSTSEFTIFKTLQNKNIADFYWDVNSPFFDNEIPNKALKFISKNVQTFKSKYDISEKLSEYPNVHTYAIPSNSGQVKYAMNIVDKLYSECNKDIDENPLYTAVVLPDENLFLPAVSSVPDNVRTVNVTMGVPLSNSSIATLISLIIKLHKNVRVVDGGKYMFYYEDVIALYSHPFMKNIMPTDCALVIQNVTKNNSFYILNDDLKSKTSKKYNDIFNAITEYDKKSLKECIKSLVDFIKNNILHNEGFNNKTLEIGFINQYVKLFNQLDSIIDSYNVSMTCNTFFFLLDRFVASAKIPLEGMPLKGLQIMGILETRCLDFENVVILSMNERMFPRKHFSRSFIPEALRRYNCMATMEYQECIYAYYFYRLISKAKNVHILYDARVAGVGSSEPSRYVEQIKYLYKLPVTEKHLTFNIEAPKEIEVSVAKDSSIIEKLNIFKSKEGIKPKDVDCLSASSINTYISCPLKFFFEYVLHFRENNEISDFIDYGTFGSIVHASLEKLYNDLPEKKVVNVKNFDDVKIEEVIKKEIIELYYKDKNKFDTYGTMLLAIIKTYVKKVLKYDEQYTDSIFMGAEQSETKSWNDLGINFKMIVDRIDVEGNKLKFIDYKTGRDKADKPKNIEEVFDTSKGNDRKKAFFQLFLYVCFYKYIKALDTDICNKDVQIAIYKLRKMTETKFYDFTEDEQNIFIQLFKEVINGLFDENIAFTQSQNSNYCTYCDFKAFCRK